MEHLQVDINVIVFHLELEMENRNVPVQSDTQHFKLRSTSTTLPTLPIQPYPATIVPTSTNALPLIPVTPKQLVQILTALTSANATAATSATDTAALTKTNANSKHTIATQTPNVKTTTKDTAVSVPPVTLATGSPAAIWTNA
jgi:hypothetical protein